MKRIILYIGIALATASCSKGDEAFDAQGGGDYVNFTASAQTRVTADGTSWEADDPIGITTISGEVNYTHNLQYKISNVGTGDMVAVSDDDRISTSSDWRVYYAYSPYSDTSYNGGNITCDLTTSQVPLLAATVASAEDFVPLTFEHQYAKLSLSFESIYDLSTATAQLTGSQAKGTYNLDSGWDTGSFSSAPIDIIIENCKATLYVLPQDVSDKGIKVEIMFGGKSYVTTLTTTNWEKGKTYSYNIGICKESLVEVTDENYSALGVNQADVGCWILYAENTDAAADDITDTSLIADEDAFYAETNNENSDLNKIYKKLLIASADLSSGLDWAGYCTAAKDYTAGGYSDWRLPTIKELLLIYAESGQEIFTSVYYWSATSYSSLTSYASYVNFSYGSTPSSYKALSSYYARPVKEL